MAMTFRRKAAARRVWRITTLISPFRRVHRLQTMRPPASNPSYVRDDVAADRPNPLLLRSATSLHSVTVTYRVQCGKARVRANCPDATSGSAADRDASNLTRRSVVWPCSGSIRRSLKRVGPFPLPSVTGNFCRLDRPTPRCDIHRVTTGDCGRKLIAARGVHDHGNFGQANQGADQVPAVNDAAALAQADLGLAMGTGTVPPSRQGTSHWSAVTCVLSPTQSVDPCKDLNYYQGNLFWAFATTSLRCHWRRPACSIP